MAIHTRPLTDEERDNLWSFYKTVRNDPILVQRARIVLLSEQGWYVPQIARQVGQHPQTVRSVVRRFNDGGIAALNGRKRRGRHALLSPEQQRHVMSLVLSEPASLGLSFPTWTLAHLRDEVVRRGLAAHVGRETLRRILMHNGVRYRAQGSWRRIDDDVL